MHVCYLHRFSQWQLFQLGHPDSYKMRYNALAHFYLIQTFISKDKVNQNNFMSILSWKATFSFLFRHRFKHVFSASYREQLNQYITSSAAVISGALPCLSFISWGRYNTWRRNPEQYYLRRLIHILASQDLISVLSEGNNKAELHYKTTKIRISMRKNDYKFLAPIYNHLFVPNDIFPKYFRLK